MKNQYSFSHLLSSIYLYYKPEHTIYIYQQIWSEDDCEWTIISGIVKPIQDFAQKVELLFSHNTVHSLLCNPLLIFFKQYLIFIEYYKYVNQQGFWKS